MSRVSDISHQYFLALSDSQSEYERLYRERANATETFYRDFFHKLVIGFNAQFENERFRARLHERIERHTGTNVLNFIAIDGSCQREQFADFITFFGGAYGSRGELELIDGKQPRIRYKRWSLDYDVSMVAWVPVPFARLEEVIKNDREQFLMTEVERINVSSVHVQVMQLAEIFLAYNAIVSSRLDAPQVLLMDLSPSAVLATGEQEHIGLAGYPYDRRALTAADITIALARPFSDDFKIPSPRHMDLYRLLVRSLDRAPTEPVSITDVASEYDTDQTRLRHAAGFLVRRGILKPLRDDLYEPCVRVDESWSYTRHFFQNLCERLFHQKDVKALQYDAPDERNIIRRRWMAPDDLSFLTSVGMRMLIEACWEKNVLFYGIVKDSSSRYLTRNFLGVTLETGFHPELRSLEVGVLPWTDRIFCETLPQIDDTLEAPWSTIEFDSTFMTLHRERPEGSDTAKIAGIFGTWIHQEKLFMRSLGQFFLKRTRDIPLMGHVVFLERLLSPTWDQPGHEQGPVEITIDTPELGKFSTYAWRDRNHVNPGQSVMMYLLSVLTPNHFAEAIGYPDPLHKADWGARTIGRTVAGMIASSTQYLRSRPLSRTFRTIRDDRQH